MYPKPPQRCLTRCLLHVCHASSIQVLNSDTKRRVTGFRLHHISGCRAFAFDEFDGLGPYQDLESKAFLQKLKMPLDQLKPFHLTVLWLSHTFIGIDVLPLLRN